MNSLSILLVVADLADNLSKALALFGGIGLAAVAIFSLFSVMHVDTAYDMSKNEKKEAFSSTRSFAKKYVPVCLILLALAALIPSEKTFYLVAASELGETSLNTEYARQIGEIIQQNLREFSEGASSK